LAADDIAAFDVVLAKPEKAIVNANDSCYDLKPASHPTFDPVIGFASQRLFCPGNP